MSKSFIWIDESYDSYGDKRFYILGAIKMNVKKEQIINEHNKKGVLECSIPQHMSSAHKITMSKVRKMNKHRKKNKIRINELHENELYSKRGLKKIKELFLKEIFQGDVNIEIHYVYSEFKNTNIVDSPELYKKMATKLLEICPSEEESRIILDVCLDKRTGNKEEREIISFLREELDLDEENEINFVDSQLNAGLQAVDNVVGTIRRFLNDEKEDESNYKIIEGFIINIFKV